MTHKHGACSPTLQILIVIFGVFAVGLSSYALEYDRLWNAELDSIKRSFTKDEVRLLKRDVFYFEWAFVSIVGTSTVLVFIHLVISLLRTRDDYYGTAVSQIFHIVIGVINIVACALMIVSVIYYDTNYSEIEKADKRSYQLEFINRGRLIKLESPHSLFFYCHLWNGKLARPNELKGIRIKKTNSKICQHLTTKLIAALFALYISLLCYCVLWFISVGDRYLDGKTLAQLFDLYGDAEEFQRDHPHHQNPAVEVKIFREQLKYQTIEDEDEPDNETFNVLFNKNVPLSVDSDSNEDIDDSILPSPAPAFIRRDGVTDTIKDEQNTNINYEVVV